MTAPGPHQTRAQHGSVARYVRGCCCQRCVDAVWDWPVAYELVRQTSIVPAAALQGAH